MESVQRMQMQELYKMKACFSNLPFGMRAWDCTLIDSYKLIA